MNRAERRRQEQQAHHEWRQQQRFISEGSSASRGLVYHPGFIHEVCGGEAERPNQRGLGGYCVECDTHVPRADLRRENAAEYYARISRPVWYADQLVGGPPK